MTTRLQLQREKRAAVQDEIVKLADKEDLTSGEEEHWQRLIRQDDRLTAEIVKLEERAERIDDIKNRTHQQFSGMPEAQQNPFTQTERDSALSIVDRHVRSDRLSAEAADRLDEHIRSDATGADSRYLAAVSDSHYMSAFGKLLAHPQDAHLRWTREEHEAFQRGLAVVQERTMNEGTGSAGQFGLPVAVDPSIKLSSNGALNPIRELARVFTINTYKWTGVTGSVVAQFVPELNEIADNSPTLVQPSIQPFKAASFVPYSIELGADYENLTAELTRAISDARDVLESDKFLTGTGTNEPAGVLNIGGTGSLTTSQRVLTNTTNVFAIGDVYSLKQALPARFLPNGQFTENPNVLDNIRRFVAAGSTNEPVVVRPGRRAS